MICPHCGSEHPDSARFCPATGAAIPPPGAACLGCGAQMESGWLRCPQCGRPVDGARRVEGAQAGIRPGLPFRTIIALVGAGVLLMVAVALAWAWPSLRPADTTAAAPGEAGQTQLPAGPNLAPTPLSEAELQRARLTATFQAAQTLSAQTLGQMAMETPADTLPGAAAAATVVLPAGPTVVPTAGWSTGWPAGWPSPTPDWQPWLACNDAPLTRLRPGVRAYVSYDPPKANRLRKKPTTSARILEMIEPGEEVDILDGPACGEGYVWWQVRSVRTGREGWTAEGTGDDYYLVPKP